MCYWSVADGKHGKMIETTIRSARRVGVTESFHVWSDKTVDGSITHMTGPFDKRHYLFKFKFLKQIAAITDFKYYVFLDADTYFVRHPGDVLRVLYGAPVHGHLESDCTYAGNTRKDWWGCPLPTYVQLIKESGVNSNGIFNINAGFWIVHRDAIDTFVYLAMTFWNYCKSKGFQFTEEAPLAYAIHMLCGNPYQHTLLRNSDLWASDWTGNFKDRLPDGTDWDFTDYMSGDLISVNPSIVHAMRSKEALLNASIK